MKLGILLTTCVVLYVVAISKRVFVSCAFLLLVHLNLYINIEIFINIPDFSFSCIIYYIHNVLDFPY
jgi:hypothetical protein